MLIVYFLNTITIEIEQQKNQRPATIACNDFPLFQEFPNAFEPETLLLLE
jgi:hypothetical protein